MILWRQPGRARRVGRASFVCVRVCACWCVCMCVCVFLLCVCVSLQLFLQVFPHVSLHVLQVSRHVSLCTSLYVPLNASFFSVRLNQGKTSAVLLIFSLSFCYCLVSYEGFEQMTHFLFFLHAVIAELVLDLVWMQNHPGLQDFGRYVHETISLHTNVYVNHHETGTHFSSGPPGLKCFWTCHAKTWYNTRFIDGPPRFQQFNIVSGCGTSTLNWSFDLF